MKGFRLSNPVFRCAGAMLLLCVIVPAHGQIIKPALGELEYRDLRSGLISRIPAYAPDWTNQSPSDPGVTMLELFAFLPENLGFQVQRDFPGLLWSDYQTDDDQSLGPLAYILIDAGYRLRFGEDLKGDDWLAGLGIDAQWTYAELVAAAKQVPEPRAAGLLGAGLMVLACLRRRRKPSRQA